MLPRVCFLLALCACVRAASVKGYFCRDPDTGHLHAVNTTWQSTSFCGNYTCKIRPKNLTTDNEEQRTIINVTRSTFEPPKLTSAENSTQHLPKPEKLKYVNNVYPKNADMFFNSEEGENAKPIYHRNGVQPSPNTAFGINSPFLSTTAEDRFLNGEEIKTISELLHTVKKSDLEAIIEIYNLAQDIYKEMDEAEASNAFNELLNNGLEKESSKTATANDIQNVIKNRTSYWYEPFVLNNVRKISDMKSEGSEFVPTSGNIYKPPNTQMQISTTTAPTYFSGTLLNNKDFGRLAYYYPMSNFQRLASYYHQQKPLYNPPAPFSNPCDPCYRHPYLPPSLKSERRTFNQPPKPTEPTMLLPYPFTYQFYNGTGYAYNNYNDYYKGDPWAYYDYKRNPYHLFNIGAEKNVAVNPNQSQSTTDQADDSKTIDAKSNDAKEKPKGQSKPWQTEPLPEEVINEIRANIAERAKLLKMPLKKRIKLERVAKVIKLDHLNRHARKVRNAKIEEPSDSTDNNENLEVYIERTTCETDTELGYFRVGNMSQPFPHCCPQKIEER